MRRVARRHNFLITKNSKGYAVFAKRNYKKGETVWVLSGDKMTSKSVEVLQAKYLRGIIDPLQVGPQEYILLDSPSIYFNHSCAPNAGVRYKSTLAALRDIKKGDEITYDYSTTIDETFECKCGSKQCRGGIFDFLAIPKRIQRYYFVNRAIPDFIIKRLIRVNKGLCPCGSKKKYDICHGKEQLFKKISHMGSSGRSRR